VCRDQPTSLCLQIRHLNKQCAKHYLMILRVRARVRTSRKKRSTRNITSTGIRRKDQNNLKRLCKHQLLPSRQR
jgi:hypothetical protein